MARKIWLLNIFEAEFGFSDVLSNYSRVYAWMANQLGHLTLGLGATLMLFWIIEGGRMAPELTCGSWLAGLVLIAGVALLLRRGSAGVHPGVFIFFSAAVFMIMVVAQVQPELGADKPLLAALLIALVVITLPGAFDACIRLRRSAVSLCVKGRTARARDPKDPLLAIGTEEDTALSWVAAITLALSGLAGAVTALFMTWPGGAGGEPAGAFHAAVAATVIAGCAILAPKIARDGRFALGGVLALWAASWEATAGFPFLSADGSPVAPDWAAALVVFAVLLLWGGFTARSFKALTPDGPSRWDGGFAVAMVIAALFAGGFALCIYLTSGNGAAVGCAMGGIIIAALKEFGGDMPKVRAEVQEARKKRESVKQIGTTVAQLRALERQYAGGALDDTTADWLFYVTGAFVAFGILTPIGPRVPEAGWTAQVEFVGLLCFVVTFLVLGRNWAYRQKAIDDCGLLRANHLCLVTSGITPAPGATRDWGLDSLATFARGATAKHLIIIGAPGAGKSRLGSALAYQAALADLPSQFWVSFPEKRRTARMLTMSALRSDYDAPRPRAALMHNQTRNFCFRYSANRDRAANVRDVDREVIPCNGAHPNPDFPAASLVVIDDCEGPRDWFDKACARLELKSGEQSTVWLIGAAPGSGPAKWIERRIRAAIASKVPTANITTIHIT